MSKGKRMPKSPDRYPMNWVSTARYAAENPETWLNVVWVQTESQAISRMKSLREFRNGILLYPTRLPELSSKLQSGFELTFRKWRVVVGWDVQMRCRKQQGPVEFKIISQSDGEN